MHPSRLKKKNFPYVYSAEIWIIWMKNENLGVILSLMTLSIYQMPFRPDIMTMMFLKIQILKQKQYIYFLLKKWKSNLRGGEEIEMKKIKREEENIFIYKWDRICVDNIWVLVQRNIFYASPHIWNSFMYNKKTIFCLFFFSLTHIIYGEYTGYMTIVYR